mgnify:CR=1 FL=1
MAESAPVYAPSAAAWSGLELNADVPFMLAQTDVNNAFYRIGVPAGLEECFLPPQVKASLLTELGIELPPDLLRRGKEAGHLSLDELSTLLEHMLRDMHALKALAL